MAAVPFLCDPVASVPYRIHRLLTDRGVPFANRACDTGAFGHSFGCLRRKHGIDHRLTKVKHPCTKSQVARMNRTIKQGEADQERIRWIVSPQNVKRFHSDRQDQLRAHLGDFIAACPSLAG